MSDTVSLRGVTAFGRHGVLAAEKEAGQRFVVDLDLGVDLARAVVSDDLAHTVNYAAVAAAVVAEVGTGSLDLVETLAARIASRVLDGFVLVEAVVVTVHKPQAPVGVPFSDVSVTLRTSRDVPVVVALGGNVGDVVATLTAAVQELDLCGLHVTAVSPLYRTAAVLEPGAAPQPDYLNAVVLARTQRAPWSVMQALLSLERQLGRVRDARWEPRTVDLDLVQYGAPGTASEVVTDDPEVTLPHPRAAQRAFVLVPWAAADPSALVRHRGRVVPIDELLSQTDASGVQDGPDWSPRW